MFNAMLAGRSNPQIVNRLSVLDNSLDAKVEVNEVFEAAKPLPTCKHCGGEVRPNILMFGDWDWDDTLSSAQSERAEGFKSRIEESLAVIELGAGLAIPSIRNYSESMLMRDYGKYLLPLRQL